MIITALQYNIVKGSIAVVYHVYLPKAVYLHETLGTRVWSFAGVHVRSAVGLRSQSPPQEAVVYNNNNIILYSMTYARRTRLLT